ncbi:MAG: hypothetical protein Q9227_000556 [Pyrenula ochraceoflavens]
MSKASRKNGPETETKSDAAFHIIVLGSSGGPREDTVSGVLVRAASPTWSRSSVVAVDAGAHLGSLIRVLEQYLPSSSDAVPDKGHTTILKDGPFAGMSLPGITAKANGVHIFRELVHSFLITHPHLDHLSGLAINTPGLEYGREAKPIVALPSTIDAIKNHIYNDIIWPNLSDESDGAGFVTYRRLIEGGNSRLGTGDNRGYVNVSDGLIAKCWSVSHGKCRRNSFHNRGSSAGLTGDSFSFPSRRISRVSENDNYMNALTHGHHRDLSGSLLPNTPGRAPNTPVEFDHGQVPVDSSAFFIRNEDAGAEVIVFGDIEPDSISILPRNQVVWEDAASKIIRRALRAIFIECSYDDAVRDEDLYGHLCPRHLIAELRFLAQRVLNLKKAAEMKGPPSPVLLRKRRMPGEMAGDKTPPLKSTFLGSPELQYENGVSSRNGSHSRGRLPRSQTPPLEPEGLPHVPVTPFLNERLHDEKNGNTGGAGSTSDPSSSMGRLVPVDEPGPLEGLTVFIIHVKDTLKDGPPPEVTILAQLEEQAREVGLGCKFSVTKWGESIWV